MAQCKTEVAPLCKQGSYVSLVLSNQNIDGLAQDCSNPRVLFYWGIEHLFTWTVQKIQQSLSYIY